MAHQWRLQNQLKHDQMVVLSRLPRVELGKLIITQILEGYGLSLMDIERELFQIIDNPFNAQLYFQGLLIDLCNMALLTGVAVDEFRVKEEILALLTDVNTVIAAVTVSGYKLMSLELELPDTLQLGYSSNGQCMRQLL